MNGFDKLRVENAIWTLEQYNYAIEQLAKESGYFDTLDCEKAFDVLKVVKGMLTRI